MPYSQVSECAWQAALANRERSSRHKQYANAAMDFLCSHLMRETHTLLQIELCHLSEYAF